MAFAAGVSMGVPALATPPADSAPPANSAPAAPASDSAPPRASVDSTPRGAPALPGSALPVYNAASRERLEARIGPAPGFQPNVRAAVAVGLFTMLVPGFIGGTRTALGVTDGEKTAGLLVASGGFALAPIFSHMVTHEWERAAQFGALPFLSTVAGTAYISRYPYAVYHGDMGTRTAFGILLGLGLLGAIGGVYDASLAGERARDRSKATKTSFYVAPAPSPEGCVLTFGGAL